MVVLPKPLNGLTTMTTTTTLVPPQWPPGRFLVPTVEFGKKYGSFMNPAVIYKTSNLFCA
jgi:hypothetical protein